MLLNSDNAEREALMITAKLLASTARTAPKSGGKDDILTAIVSGDEKDKIVSVMREIGAERNISGFERDAKNTEESEIVVLVGVRGNRRFGLDCGACGFKNCQGFEDADKIQGIDFHGPTCIFKALDLGIALGSAVKTASTLNADNRIMYRIGTACMRLGYLPEATVIMGIPLSSTGKSIYFDRR